MMNRSLFLVALLVCGSCARICFGLAEEHVGPVTDAVAQPGMPAGITKMLRSESRVYSIWVNGNENFYYQANVKQVNELIEQFSKMRLRDHELTVKLEKQEAKTFLGPTIPYNVQLHVLSGIALAVTKRDAEARTYEPTLTIHVDPKEDAELLKRISLPDNIILKNEIEDLPLMGGTTKPQRKVRYAHLQFEDGKPAADFEHGVSTAVALWEKDVEDCIRLGKVSHEGYFHAAFSKQEIEDLRKGRTWLTLTVGNWSTNVDREHPRLDPDTLVLDRDKAKPVKIDQPKFYYGRILFEDGSPPVLDPEPWPGGKIKVEFSYAGGGQPDAEGYFKVYFAKEQFEAVKEKKARRNIYIPSYEKKGRSSARHVFPASKLSQDKKTAGVVKIPKPRPKSGDD